MGILVKAPQDVAYEKGLSKGIREGRVEGVAAERQRWIDFDRRMRHWHKRSADAQKRGESFDEPMPRSPLDDD